MFTASIGGKLCFCVREQEDTQHVCHHQQGRRLSDKPGLVVTWTSDASAKKFIAAKGIVAEYEVAPLTEDSLIRMAKALGCDADVTEFDAYPD